jgi:hypothetical protein
MVSREDRITRRLSGAGTAAAAVGVAATSAGGTIIRLPNRGRRRSRPRRRASSQNGTVYLTRGSGDILSPVAYRASSPWKLWCFYWPLLKVHWRDAVRRLASLASGTVFWVGVVIALVLGLNNQIGTWLRVTGLHFSPWFAALRPSARLRVTRRKVRLEKCRIAGW